MTTSLMVDDVALLTSYLVGDSNPVEESRERIIAACELVNISLRTPIEIARKHAFSTLDQAITRAVIGLNLFPLLSADYEDHPRVITTTELAANTTVPCPPTLL
jgi:hypothetical protein